MRLKLKLSALMLLAFMAPSHAQSLEALAQYVLNNHPRVRAAEASARSVRHEIDQAQAAKAAKFGVIADPGIGYSRIEKDWDQAGDLGVRGTYLMYDGQRTNNEISRQRSRFSSAEQRANSTEEQLLGQLSDAYVETLKQEKLQQLARQNVEAHSDLYRKVEEIVKHDKGRAYDLTQVSARLQQARVTLASREGAQQEARALLSEIAGKAAAEVSAPRDPSTALPATRQAAFDRLAQHPALLAAQAEVEVAQRASSIAGAWDRPRVDLQGTVNSPQDVDGDRKYLGNYDLRFVVQWQPFDGGAGRSAARAASEQLNAAKDNRDSIRRDLSNEVARFWSQMETRRARGLAWSELVTQTSKVRENYWMQFKIGRRSIVDLLNAENETFQARSSAEQEKLEVMQAQYRLLASMGQLGKFLGVAAPAPAATPSAGAAGAAPSALPDLAPAPAKRK